MNETLEQETTEEFEAKYNLIFENPVDSDVNSINTVNQIIDTNSEIAQSKDELLEQELVQECTALVTVKERRLIAAQTMFKKSIKISIKSFLISLSLSFLNLFI